MPYTIKTTVTCRDMPADQVIAKIKELSTVDFREGGFDPAPIIELRQQHKSNGNLLARGLVMTPDGTALTTVQVWKSRAVYEAFLKHPTVIAYGDAMRAQGFTWTVTTP